MQKSNLKTCAIVLICMCLNVNAQTKKFVCTPENGQTQIYFQGKLFVLSVTNKCLSLQNMERKNTTWSWKIHTTNSLGNAEGARATNCNDPSSVSVGEPAVWYSADKTLHIYSVKQKDTFNCEIAP
jgi:hypothetical protein